MDRAMRSQKELAYDEARMVRDIAEREAKVIRTNAELEARLVRDSAEKEARLAVDSAKREADSNLAAAKNESQRVQKQANETLARLAFESDERASHRSAEDEEHAKKLIQARTELQLLRGKIMSSQTELSESQAAQLVAERDKMQVRTERARVMVTRRPDLLSHGNPCRKARDYCPLTHTPLLLPHSHSVDLTFVQAQLDGLHKALMMDRQAFEDEVQDALADKRRQLHTGAGGVPAEVLA